MRNCRANGTPYIVNLLYTGPTPGEKGRQPLKTTAPFLHILSSVSTIMVTDASQVTGHDYCVTP